jgi:hypothetical protein
MSKHDYELIVMRCTYMWLIVVSIALIIKFGGLF